MGTGFHPTRIESWDRKFPKHGLMTTSTRNFCLCQGFGPWKILWLSSVNLVNRERCYHDILFGKGLSHRVLLVNKVQTPKTTRTVTKTVSTLSGQPPTDWKPTTSVGADPSYRNDATGHHVRLLVPSHLTRSRNSGNRIPFSCLWRRWICSVSGRH